MSDTIPIYRQLVSLIGSLTEPSKTVKDPAERRNARLLSQTTLLMTVGALIVNFVLLFADSSWIDSFYFVMVGALIFFMAYVISHTPYYTIGVVIAALLPSIIEYVSYTSNPEHTSIAATMIISLILGSMLSSMRNTVLLVLANIVLLLTIPFIADVVTGEWALNLMQLMIAGMLIIGSKLHTKRLEDERKAALEQSYQNMRSVLENLPIMVTAINADDEIVLWNTAAKMTTSLQANMIDGLPHLIKLFDLPLSNADVVTPFWGREVTLLQANGFKRYLSLFNMGQRFPVPGWSFWMVAIDITEIKQQNDMMLEYKRITDSFQQTRDRNALMQKVISALSHDLRIPLSVIMTSTDTLSRYHDRLSDDQRERKLRGILNQVKVATELLTDTVYTIRNVDRNRELKLMPVNLMTLCEVSIQEIGTMADDKHRFELINHDDVGVAVVDEILINRILINLLSNAIKYSPQGGPIKIELQQDKEWITLDVVDHGLGISEDDLPYIFDLFYRAQEVSSIVGTGMGLNTVKECVDAHDGRITVTSQPDEETRFTVLLPRLQESDAGKTQ